MNKISRKTFLKDLSYISLGIISFANMLMAAEKGALILKNILPIENDVNGILKLMKGFSYKVISEKGQLMSDGLTVPDYADGMASFKGENGTIILVRNHEIGRFKTIEKILDKNPVYKNSNYINKNKSLIYDSGTNGPCCGGTSTIVYNPKTQEIENECISLLGTLVNCAGGVTPWGTWISCEETEDRANRSLEHDHGYNFEVPATSRPRLTPAVPLKSMGRFNHEAVAFDVPSGVVYQTEDRGDGLFYRFLPSKPGELQAGGVLQALAVADRAGADTRNWGPRAGEFHLGESHPVKWIDLQQIDAPRDDLRYRGREQGAACFARGEGIWAAPGACYFVCSSGGARQQGQIWRYRPSVYEGTQKESKAPGELELFVEPNDTRLLNNADNLTVAPWGDVVVCEDQKRSVVRLVGINPAGGIYTLAHSRMRTEFTGVTFSPDGTTLFVNAQGKGLAIAITGPWKQSIA